MTALLLALLLQPTTAAKDRETVLKEGGAVTEKDKEGTYFAEWLPADVDKQKEGSVRLLASLHGTGGHAETETRVWLEPAKQKGVGVISLQWQLDKEKWLTPQECYKRFDERIAELRKQHPAVAAKGHLLHGFSRGSANVPGLARIDRETKKDLFSHFVCNAGAWPPENPPPYMRDVKDDAFKGQIFLGYSGGKDEHQDKAVAYGKAMKEFVEKRGGTIAKWWELPEGKHATFHLTPDMLEETLETWLK